MATQVIKQFLSTIHSGTSFTWSMGNANPLSLDVDYPDRQPQSRIVEWQAAPIFIALVTLPPPGTVLNQRPGIRLDPVTIVEEEDTSQTHIFTLTCSDLANTGVGFVLTYVLYAIFTDVN